MHDFVKFGQNSLWFYRRTNLWVWLGIAIGTAVLTGALIVGDSVSFTLMRQGLDRVGEARYAITSGERLFTWGLADRLQERGLRSAAPVLLLPGTASYEGRQANRVQLIGVDERFFELWPKTQANLGWFDSTEDDTVYVNDHLAARLKLNPGDEMVIRIKKPIDLPGNIPLADRENVYVSKRVKVGGILDDRSGGRFDLNPRQIASGSVFIPIRSLGALLKQEDSANLLLLKEAETKEGLLKNLKKSWRLSDIQLDLREIRGGTELKLRSRRFFIDSAVSECLAQSRFEPEGVITYLVNSLDLGDNSTPYSFVSGVGRMSASLGDSDSDADSIEINAWIKDDLAAGVGDRLKLKYFVIGKNGKLEETESEFEIARILPMRDVEADRDFMPEIPGLSDVEDCRNWDPGFPVDLDRIRSKDETYWNDYGGLPKAYIPLETARKLWSNAYGEYTAVRFSGDRVTADQLSIFIRENVEPSSLGFQVIPVRQEAVNAAGEALDFRQLFIALSFVVIAGALVLTGLIFRAGFVQRQEEIRTLRCCGYSTWRVLYLFGFENVILVVSASICGVFGGVLYNQFLIWALETIWSGAIGSTNLYISIKISSLIIGTIVGMLLPFCVLMWAIFKMASDRKSLVPGYEGSSIGWRSKGGRLFLLSVSILMVFGALLLMFLYRPEVGKNMSGVFFGIGFLLLTGLFGILGSGLFVSNKQVNRCNMPGFWSLVFQQLKRDPQHTLLVSALLALGVFSVIGVSANRQQIGRDWMRKSSGSGGFGLYAETAFPFRQDLNDPKVRYQLGLEAEIMDSVNIISLMQHGSGDASCFNLNRVARPRLVAVNPTLFQERNSFLFVGDAYLSPDAPDWTLLDKSLGTGEIPAVIDQNVMLWGLGKKIGDTLDYQDEQGNPLTIRLVGAIGDSVFQGSLLISEQNMSTYFPAESGAQILLLDTPHDPEQMSSIVAALNRALQDYGVETMTTKQRLESFLVVENTYLSIFLFLGGLGMVLGVGGFGIVVFRDIMDRRSEYAILRATGFSLRSIQGICCRENLVILTLGIVIGTLSSVVAVWPVLMTSGKSVPWSMLVWAVTVVLLTGVLSILASVGMGLKGALVHALRKE